MFTLKSKERNLHINKPVVMGIINITPDSFYAESRQQTIDAALRKTETMLREGALIIDIGGQSTRPQSILIKQDEELARVTPVIEKIKKEFPDCFISIDTFYATVARKAVEHGADIVNDISGGILDTAMISTVANLQVPFVCMHMKGTPQTMQQLTQYKNVTQEVKLFLEERIKTCEEAGINDIIIDPGFGFAKNIEQNFTLFKNLSTFKTLQKPLLLGISRKSMIYKFLNIQPEESLNGTTALHALGLLNGADILRVHDVKEAVQVIALIEKYLQ